MGVTTHRGDWESQSQGEGRQVSGVMSNKGKSEMLTAENYLELVRKRGAEGKPINRVYLNMLRHKELFLRAYGKLYRNQGATTPGADGQTVDGMSMQKIDNLIEELAERRFKWTPAKRVYIPKGNGKMRPLGIPTWKDKVVQEVIRTILENYYEPKFSDNSHGFRPGRGCHTALWKINTWTGTVWFIEGDIKGCFDNIDHEVLMDIISRDIQDPSLLKLIKYLLKAGYMDNWKYHKTHSGTPQGSILSPLLANIYLNEFDQWVEQVLIPEYTTGEKRPVNQERRKLVNSLRAIRERGEIRRAKEIEQTIRKMPSGDTFAPEYRRLKYMRYADDFILGFIGSREEAQEIKHKISAMLQSRLKLEMSEEKTLITHAKTEFARFLGYDIHIQMSTVRKRVNGLIGLRVPKDVVKKWERKYSRNGKPIQRGSFINLTVAEIIRQYETELRGLYEYYKYANNVGAALSKIKTCMKTSLVKTLANKLKIRARKVFQKYEVRNPAGIQVILKDGRKVSFGHFPLTRQRYGQSINDNQRIFVAGRNELIERLEADYCEIPGCNATVVEGHHIRALKDLKKKYEGKQEIPLWVETMIARRRKTLMVCAYHHRQIHDGRYDGPNLKRLADRRAG